MLEAADWGLLVIPPAVAASKLSERARWGALELLRIRERAAQGDRQAADFCRRHQIPGTEPVADLRGAVRIERPAITRRTLIYHCCPLKANDGWLENMRQLLEHWGIFDRRYIALAYGEGLHDPAEVLQLIDRLHSGAVSEAQWVCLPNDPLLRETASFLPLLIAAQSTRDDEATFYGHTKGNSTAWSEKGARLWRDVMYQRLLGRWEECMEHLGQYATVGCHKMIWPPDRPPYPTGLRHGNWMFSGTFFWFRNDDTFVRNWRHVPADRYGTEAWISGLYRPQDGKSVYQVWPEHQYPTPNPYEPATYERPEL